ncbi:hypothetical protein QFC19_002792 [Naganishia cerealis]|uniref:Uncharacterized protein n=1 Tax=Naganishia cerealis TaxID=610337 RepID=A0ACC2W941_9TREE|nr:hypothetical protein QFC19_002792 [Naganishia cerealis]
MVILLENPKNYDRFLAVHRSIQDPWATVPYDNTTSLLFACSLPLRQAIITHLIYLYSHFTPSLDPYAVIPAQDAREITKDVATRSMFILRCVLQFLATHTARPWCPTINPWQSHLLQHYERLSPFPVSTTSEDGVISEVLGPEWTSRIQLRTHSRQYKMYDLASWSRTLGLTLSQVAADLETYLVPERAIPWSPNYREENNDVRLHTVQSLCGRYYELSAKILTLVRCREGTEHLEKPPMVALNSWYGLGERDELYEPSFLYERPSRLNRSSAAFEDMFPPSGLPQCNETVYLEREKELIPFGVPHSSDDEQRGPPRLRVPRISTKNAEAGPSRSSWQVKNRMMRRQPQPQPLTTPKRMGDIIDLSMLTDSEPSSPNPHHHQRGTQKYRSPPPSRSPSPASLQVVKTHGWTALAVIKKEPPPAEPEPVIEPETKAGELSKWGSEDEAEEVSRNQYSQSTEDARPVSLERAPSRSDSSTGLTSSDQLIDESTTFPAPTATWRTAPSSRSPRHVDAFSAVYGTNYNADDDGKSAVWKRSADDMEPEPPEGEGATVKRVRATEQVLISATTRRPVSLARFSLEGRGRRSSSDKVGSAAQISEDNRGNSDATECRRDERGGTIDSEMWADILRSGSESEADHTDADDMKPIVLQAQSPDTEHHASRNFVHPSSRYDEDQRERRRDIVQQRNVRMKTVSNDPWVHMLRVDYDSESESDDDDDDDDDDDRLGLKRDVKPRKAAATAEEAIPDERPPLRQNILPIPLGDAANRALNRGSVQRLARGLHRAMVAIDVIRRQLTRVHVGSQLSLRIGRNEKGRYDVHQDVREESKSEATPASAMAADQVFRKLTMFSSS